MSTISDSAHPDPPAGAPSSGPDATGAVPRLCGQPVGGRVGPEPVEWMLWPVEVYACGALLRVRLTPLRPWREYEDRELFRTVVAPATWAGHHHEIVAATAEAGPLLWTHVDLPNGGVEPHHDDKPWDHSWTLQFWWPRPDWRSPVRLSWPARGVDVELPVDPAELETVAAGCPDPPEITVEAHHPGFDDVTPGPTLGLEAHQPRSRRGSPGRPPKGGTRYWPHYGPGPETDDPGDPQ